MNNQSAKAILRNMSLWSFITVDEFKALQLGIKALEPTKSIDIVQAYCNGLERVWIPCKEKLPSENGHYLVSCKDGFVSSDDYFSYGWDDYDDVIAWMPLPKPYKEGGKNEP